MKILKCLIPVILVLSILAGCGSGAASEASAVPEADSQAQSATAEGAEAPGGDYKVLNVGRMSELFDMDSTIATEADCLEVIEAIIEPLFVTAADGTPVNALCESYEMNEEGTE